MLRFARNDRVIGVVKRPIECIIFGYDLKYGKTDACDEAVSQVQGEIPRLRSVFSDG